MKSKYLFEKMELDGEIVAVPVGDNASEFHAVLNVNQEAMRILELLKEDTTVEKIVDQLLSEYEESSKEDVYPLVNTFIDTLRKEGILDE